MWIVIDVINYLFLVFCAISFWLTGYALSYGQGNQFFGCSSFASSEDLEGENGFWFIQYVYAATTATIISGAVAERCNFISYIFYSLIISGKFSHIVIFMVIWWKEKGRVEREKLVALNYFSLVQEKPFSIKIRLPNFQYFNITYFKV